MIRHSRSIFFCLKIRNKSVVEAGEDLEPQPEPEERTIAVLKLTKGRGIIEAGIKVFRAASSKNYRMNYEDICLL
jgi:hypothetical protein